VIKNNEGINYGRNKNYQSLLLFREGTYNNIAENNIGTNMGSLIAIYRGHEEDAQATQYVSLNNTYRNNILNGGNTAI